MEELLNKYGKYIDLLEYSTNWHGEKLYSCYLKGNYTFIGGSNYIINNTLNNIRAELKSLKNYYSYWEV